MVSGCVTIISSVSVLMCRQDSSIFQLHFRDGLTVFIRLIHLHLIRQVVLLELLEWVNELTAFLGLGDKLDALVGPGPPLDNEVHDGVACGWQMLTGTDGTDEGDIAVVRVFSCGGRHGGGMASLSRTLAAAAAAACSLSFHQL